jgi:SpoVK/Ycf46/Vps4 family AAA+-type ATPase
MTPPETIYKYRWNVQIVSDKLNIDLSEILGLDPFRSNRKDFIVLLRTPFPRSLEGDKFTELRTFLLERSGQLVTLMESKKQNTTGNEEKPYTIDELCKNISISRENIQEWEEILNEKRQVIFYGPPGTGKTYVAKEFSKYLTSQGGTVQLVQFHPSYSYEDFIEGIRPDITNKKELTYDTKDAVLKIFVIWQEQIAMKNTFSS